MLQLRPVGRHPVRLGYMDLSRHWLLSRQNPDRAGRGGRNRSSLLSRKERPSGRLRCVVSLSAELLTVTVNKRYHSVVVVAAREGDTRAVSGQRRGGRGRGLLVKIMTVREIAVRCAPSCGTVTEKN